MKQALWNLGVPAVYFISCLETVPYGMGWKRVLVVHVGKLEAQCLILADGASLVDTFQGMSCCMECCCILWCVRSENISFCARFICE